MDRRHLLKAMALSAGGLLLPVESAWAKKRTVVSDIRIWTAPDHTRVVFDLNQPVKHTLFRLDNPNRVVLDLMNAEISSRSKLKISDELVRRVRTGHPKPGVTRTVFEVNERIKPRSFLLEGDHKQGPRLVLDLIRQEGSKSRKERSESKSTTRRKSNRKREAVIVIDPGHGGEDPGAVGALGTQEKDVALKVARQLQGYINKESGMRAHLTRTGDYFVSLRRRVSIARSHNADLFISLHADAFRDSSARGASVYTLSEKGKLSPDKAIKALVKRENSADLIGGVDLDQVSDPEVRGILMDLSQRDSLNRALVLGKNILGSLNHVPKLKMHRKDVKQASFAVLKAPDIPSVLVEMAFLTNRHEERLLRGNKYQEELARAMLKGAKRYVRSSQLA
ncbi:MAG: N-acetylmuramoyl-L-alanine amidase [Magnetococcales bacterium]|nr:N-acetylmuramoyl-L-alanine amidase [Magnetococcales bacterium]